MSTSSDLQKYSLPMIVPVSIDETEAEFNVRWEKFDALDENVKDILASEKAMEIVQQIAKKYSLSDDQMADVARMIRSYYFGELKKTDFENYMISNAAVDQKTGSQIGQLTTKYIINKDVSSFINEPRYVKENKIKKTQLPLIKALGLYPKIEHQIISTTPLNISNQSKSVSGTVKNWVYDYRDSLGSGKHSSMQRGTYLFNTDNTKILSASDRNKVSTILRSHDEGAPLSIDVTNKQILFPETTTPVADVQTVKPQETQKSNISKIHSNASFAMPAQKRQTKQETTISAGTASTQERKSQENIQLNGLGRPQKQDETLEKGASPKLSSASKTVRQVTQQQEKHHLIGTEDEMTFTSPHALPSEKEKLQQEKDKTPFHMNPIGTQKAKPTKAVATKS